MITSCNLFTARYILFIRLYSILLTVKYLLQPNRIFFTSGLVRLVLVNYIDVSSCLKKKKSNGVENLKETVLDTWKYLLFESPVAVVYYSIIN